MSQAIRSVEAVTLEPNSTEMNSERLVENKREETIPYQSLVAVIGPKFDVSLESLLFCKNPRSE